MKNLYRGMLAGLVVGATISMIADPINPRMKKAMKRKVGKTVRAVGCALDDLHMF